MINGRLLKSAFNHAQHCASAITVLTESGELTHLIPEYVKDLKDVIRLSQKVIHDYEEAAHGDET